MRRIIIIIFLFLLETNINPQTFDIGIGQQSYLLGNKNYKSSIIGVKIHGRYLLNQNYSLLTNASGMFVPYERGNDFHLGTDGFFTFQLEESILFAFKKINFKPYLGLGIGYYINKKNATSGHITKYFNDNELIFGESIENSFGVVINGGISDFYGLLLEIKYVFFYPKIELDLHNVHTFKRRKVEETINLSGLYFSIVYEFKLF